MKALSIRQPWAEAIVSLGKDVENRNWATTYRGPILIHAAKTMTPEEMAEFEAMVRDFPRKLRPLQTLALGCVVGVAELFDCVTESSSAWFVGPYGFKLRHARKVEPFPVRGMPGLFEVPCDIPLFLPETVH